MAMIYIPPAGGGGSQDLQQVTDVGNETTNDIVVGDMVLSPLALSKFNASATLANNLFELRAGTALFQLTSTTFGSNRAISMSQTNTNDDQFLISKREIFRYDIRTISVADTILTLNRRLIGNVCYEVISQDINVRLPEIVGAINEGDSRFVFTRQTGVTISVVGGAIIDGSSPAAVFPLPRYIMHKFIRVGADWVHLLG